MCGSCCKNLRGRLGDIDISIIPSHGSFLFMAVPPSLKTIILLEWEVAALTKLANRLSVNITFKPDLIFWDENSDKALVIGWNLEHENCPFLSNENRCRIYESRPLACQAFPIFSTGLEEYLKGEPYFLNLGDCPNVVSPYPEVKDTRPRVLGARDYFSTLYKVYGETFIGAYQSDFAGLWISNLISKLRGLSIIQPVAIKKKKTVKAILRSKPVGLLKHLVVNGFITKEQVQERISEINTIDKEKIHSFLRML